MFVNILQNSKVKKLFINILICFRVAFTYALIYNIYEKNTPHRLIGKLFHPLDFFLFPLGNLVNRDGIPWFHQVYRITKTCKIIKLCQLSFPSGQQGTLWPIPLAFSTCFWSCFTIAIWEPIWLLWNMRDQLDHWNTWWNSEGCFICPEVCWWLFKSGY